MGYREGPSHDHTMSYGMETYLKIYKENFAIDGFDVDMRKNHIPTKSKF